MSAGLVSSKIFSEFTVSVLAVPAPSRLPHQRASRFFLWRKPSSDKLGSHWKRTQLRRKVDAELKSRPRGEGPVIAKRAACWFSQWSLPAWMLVVVALVELILCVDYHEQRWHNRIVP